jgi:hypothetical protein
MMQFINLNQGLSFLVFLVKSGIYGIENIEIYRLSF